MFFIFASINLKYTIKWERASWFLNTDQYDLSELKNGQYTLRVVVVSLNLDSRFAFQVGDGEATDLTSLSRHSAPTSVYDVYGRRSFKSGLHIENGKVVFKWEKIYKVLSQQSDRWSLCLVTNWMGGFSSNCSILAKMGVKQMSYFDLTR